MKEERRRIAYNEPKWFTDESNRLADEWFNSHSKLDIVEYILLHASEKYKKEYEYAMSIG